MIAKSYRLQAWQEWRGLHCHSPAAHSVGLREAPTHRAARGRGLRVSSFSELGQGQSLAGIQQDLIQFSSAFPVVYKMVPNEASGLVAAAPSAGHLLSGQTCINLPHCTFSSSSFALLLFSLVLSFDEAGYILSFGLPSLWVGEVQWSVTFPHCCENDCGRNP